DNACNRSQRRPEDSVLPAGLHYVFQRSSWVGNKIDQWSYDCGVKTGEGWHEYAFVKHWSIRSRPIQFRGVHCGFGHLALCLAFALDPSVTLVCLGNFYLSRYSRSSKLAAFEPAATSGSAKVNHHPSRKVNHHPSRLAPLPNRRGSERVPVKIGSDRQHAVE